MSDSTLATIGLSEALDAEMGAEETVGWECYACGAKNAVTRSRCHKCMTSVTYSNQQRAAAMGRSVGAAQNMSVVQKEKAVSMDAAELARTCGATSAAGEGEGNRPRTASTGGIFGGDSWIGWAAGGAARGVGAVAGGAISGVGYVAKGVGGAALKAISPRSADGAAAAAAPSASDAAASGGGATVATTAAPASGPSTGGTDVPGGDMTIMQALGKVMHTSTSRSPRKSAPVKSKKAD
eukprot:g6975.t1